jgi:hypothetical protein
METFSDLLKTFLITQKNLHHVFLSLLFIFIDSKHVSYSPTNDYHIPPMIHSTWSKIETIVLEIPGRSFSFNTLFFLHFDSLTGYP